MKSKILHILITATLVPISIPGHSQPAYEQVGRRDLKVERAYTERRWIGLRRKGIAECPKVDGWKANTLENEVLCKVRENLRAAGTVISPDPEHEILPSAALRRSTTGPAEDCSSAVLSRPADRTLLQKLELDRYCIYTPLTTPAVKFQRPAGLRTAERDRLAISTTSTGDVPTDNQDDLTNAIWPTLAQHFRSQTAQETSGGKPAFVLTGKEPGVRLTFIDSQPDGVWPPVYPYGSKHGFTLAHLAHDLACPTPSSCAAEIATRRALGYWDFDPKQPLPPADPPNGQSGHVGLVSDLATALFAEVLYWRQHEPDKKLILNLSLGWDGEGFGDLDARCVSQLEPSVRAVYNALRFARRSGALVIASAGNQRGGGETRWPLLPAAWELRRPNWFRWGFGHKPVFAVGGVEGQGLPIANARDKGRPRRVAYADHAVTQAGSPDSPTAIYTGTSVSATVTSSIAAVVWHLRPELRPAEVIRLIARSGDVLDTRADFYAWKPFAKLVRAPRTKRLSLCPAVARACGPDGKRCPALASSPECLPWDASPPDLQKPLAGLYGKQCASITLLPGALPEQPVYMTSQRWVIPQPDTIPCPGCAVVQREPPDTFDASFGYKLKLQIGAGWIQEAALKSFIIKKGTLFIDCGEPDPYHQELPETTYGPFYVPGPSEVLYVPIKISGQTNLSGCTAWIDYDVEDPNEPIPVKNPVSLPKS